MTAARVMIVCALLLVACEHGAPFQPGQYGPGGPFGGGGLVTRLTFNPGVDSRPTWLPSGAGIGYTAERLDRADRDHCLAVLPPGGGAISRYHCQSTAANDSLDVFEDAAFAADGRVAYVRAASQRFPIPIGPDAHALMVGSVGDPAGASVLRALPFSLATAGPYEAVSDVAWLDSARVLYVAQRVRYPRPCSSCAPDTVRTGLKAVIVNLTGRLLEVPRTDSVSSVAVGATDDTLYFTRNGDSRVYRYMFSSNDTAVVHDFGGAGIARDLSVAAGRLAAVVGGDVFYTADSILGPSQPDRGGPLRFVVLATGAETGFGDGTSRFRRPALSPDGTRVVFEDWTGPRPDIWVMGVP